MNIFEKIFNLGVMQYAKVEEGWVKGCRKIKKVGENRPEGDTAIANFVQFSRQA